MRCTRQSAGFAAILSITVILAACSSGSEKRPKYSSAVQALARMYETSSGTFLNSQIQVRVRERGVVDVGLDGELLQKPKADGDAWIPLLLMQELPDYFQNVADSGGTKVQLEAYQLKGKMWCIAAVVPWSSPGSRPPSEPHGLSEELHLNLLLFSPKFSAELPFLVPAGQGSNQVIISVTLPKGAHFFSTQAVSALSSVPGQPPGQNPRQLTILPASLAAGNVKASATIYPRQVAAWDFSAISFSSPGFFSPYRPWFIPVAVAAIMLAVVAWVQLVWSPNLNARILGLQETRQQVIARIDGLAQDAIARFGEEAQSEAYRRAWTLKLAELRESLLLLPFKTGDSAELDYLSFALYHDQTWIQTDLPELWARLELVKTNLKSLSGIQVLLGENYARRGYVAWGLSVIGIAILICLLLALADVARAQTLPRAAPTRDPLATLCDLTVALTPQDPLAGLPNQVGVSLRFMPFTEDRQSEGTEIDVGAGSAPQVTIDPLQLTDTRIKMLQQTEHLVRLEVPAKYAAMLTRIKALSDFKVAKFKVPDEYFQATANGDSFSVSYVLRGAEVFHTHAASWPKLHLFPFDNADVAVPLDLRQAALLSEIQVQRPSTDYEAEFTINGLEVALTADESENRYEFHNADATFRTAMWAGQGVIVKATFRRAAFQRWGLTLGSAILAVAVGLLLGWLTKRPAIDNWIGTVVAAFSIFGLPFTLRTAVFATYKTLPTIFTGQGVTIFEIFFGFSMVLMLAACLIGRRIW